MFCKDSAPQDRAHTEHVAIRSCSRAALPNLNNPQLCPNHPLQPESPVPTLLQTSLVYAAQGRSDPSGRGKATIRAQPSTSCGLHFPISTRRVLSLWNSQLDTYIIKTLSHLPHEGTVRHSSPFDDTNSYFDFASHFCPQDYFLWYQ